MEMVRIQNSYYELFASQRWNFAVEMELLKRSYPVERVGYFAVEDARDACSFTL